MSYAEAEDLHAVRAFVRARASALGLARNRIELLALAVSELATNTVQHSRSGGRIRLWAHAGQLICEILDRGAVPALGRAMPTAESLRGRGLAIVERVCDEVAVHAGPHGSRIELKFGL